MWPRFGDFLNRLEERVAFGQQFKRLNFHLRALRQLYIRRQNNDAIFDGAFVAHNKFLASNQGRSNFGILRLLRGMRFWLWRADLGDYSKLTAATSRNLEELLLL
jgi:hypothetical protein